MHRLAKRAWKRIAIGLVACAAFAGPNLIGSSQVLAGETGSEFGLVGRCIVIDAGHGTPDSGARGISGVHEKDITLPVAHRLGEYLQQAGAKVVYTRSSDEDLATDDETAQKRRQSTDLRNRVRIAKKNQADAFISVHCNADPGSAWSGAQTLYQRDNPEGERMAKLMQSRFKEILLPTSRHAEDTSTFYLLRRIPKAAVISEIGFITNPLEGSKLQTPQYQDTVACAMYLSLIDYFAQSQPTPPVPAADKPA